MRTAILLFALALIAPPAAFGTSYEGQNEALKLPEAYKVSIGQSMRFILEGGLMRQTAPYDPQDRIAKERGYRDWVKHPLPNPSCNDSEYPDYCERYMKNRCFMPGRCIGAEPK